MRSVWTAFTFSSPPRAARSPSWKMVSTSARCAIPYGFLFIGILFEKRRLWRSRPFRVPLSCYVQKQFGSISLPGRVHHLLLPCERLPKQREQDGLDGV